MFKGKCFNDYLLPGKTVLWIKEYLSSIQTKRNHSESMNCFLFLNAKGGFLLFCFWKDLYIRLRVMAMRLQTI